MDTATPSAPLLQMRGITTAFPGSVALAGADLTVGEVRFGQQAEALVTVR